MNTEEKPLELGDLIPVYIQEMLDECVLGHRGSRATAETANGVRLAVAREFGHIAVALGCEEWEGGRMASHRMLSDLQYMSEVADILRAHHAKGEANGN